VAHLRRLGFRIAVDDLGEGYSGLNSFAQLEPDVVKLDMALIRGNRTPRRPNASGARRPACVWSWNAMVAEGVETEASATSWSDPWGADLFRVTCFRETRRPVPVPRI